MNKLLFAGLTALCLTACGGGTDQSSTGTDATSADTAPAEATPPQAEFADAKYTEIGRSAQTKFASGDIDGWLAAYADDARYNWSAGDSLVGKAAISAYWKDRFANVLSSIKFSNQVLLPVKVNRPQANEAPGTWLLSWYQVDASYKNGKSLTFWAHMIHHFNASDQIDQTVLYIDRAPILAATSN